MADTTNTDPRQRTPAAGNPGFELSHSALIDLTIRLALIFLLAYWCLLLLRPFATILIWSIVMTVALFPVFEWCSARLGGYRRLTAALITAASLSVVLGPVTWLGVSLIESLRTLSERLMAGEISIPPPSEAVKTWPLIGEQAYDFWDLAATNLKSALVMVSPQLKPIGSSLFGFAATAGGAILQFIAGVIISGFLFAPGQSLVDAVKRFSSRIDAKRGERFVTLAGATIRNVSRGVIGISMLQALLAGVGFLAAGVPAAGLATFAVLVLGIVQIGPSLVLIPLIAWSWLTMSTAAALLFTAYMVPVNLLDNVLRPIVMAHGLTTPMPVILIGILGGTLAHGIIGVFLGPIILAVAWELLAAWAPARQLALAAELGGEETTDARL